MGNLPLVGKYTRNSLPFAGKQKEIDTGKGGKGQVEPGEASQETYRRATCHLNSLEKSNVGENWHIHLFPVKQLGNIGSCLRPSQTIGPSHFVLSTLIGSRSLGIQAEILFQSYMEIPEIELESRCCITELLLFPRTKDMKYIYAQNAVSTSAICTFEQLLKLRNIPYILPDLCSIWLRIVYIHRLAALCLQ